MTTSTMTGLNGALAGRAMVGAAAVLFGTSAVAVTLLAPGLDAVTAACWRILIGGLALVVLTAISGAAPWLFRWHWRPILLGSTAFLVFQLGFFAAVDRAGVATATIVTIGTGPAAAGILDRWRHGVVLRRRWWIGVLTAGVGIAVMSGSGGVRLDWLGLLFSIVAGCCFPLFGSAIRDLTADRPTLTAVATVFGAAGVPAVVLVAAVGSDPFASSGVTASLLYLGLVTTAVAYALWGRGLAVLALSDTVTLTMLEPIAATVLAVLILHEQAGMLTLIGVLGTMIGVWIATTGSSIRADQR